MAAISLTMSVAYMRELILIVLLDLALVTQAWMSVGHWKWPQNSRELEYLTPAAFRVCSGKWVPWDEVGI